MNSAKSNFIAKWWVRVLVTGLLGLMAMLAFLSVKDDSATNDEIAHIAAGYSYLTQQDYRLNPEHPPLVKDLAAIPLLFFDLNFPLEHPSWTKATNDQWGVGRLFLYFSGNDADQILFWARLPMIFILVALGLFLFYWTKKIAGVWAGIFALILFVFSPTFLAHGRLVTTDVAATLGFLVSIYFYLRFLRFPSWQNTLFVGVSLGIALLLKFSLIVLFPFFLFLAAFFIWLNSKKEGKRLLKRYIPSSIAVVLFVFLIIGLVYGLHLISYPAEKQVIDSKVILAQALGADPAKVPFEFVENSFVRPYGHYLMGLLRTLIRVESPVREYFLGVTGLSGWWYYFPVMYFFKVPLSLHLLLLISIGTGLFFLFRNGIRGASAEKIKQWLRNHLDECAMFSFVIFYSAIAMSTEMNYGVRYLLPLFPFLYILAALGLKKWIREVKFPPLKVKLLILFLLGAWYVSSSVAAFPQYLSYYNELAGGMEHGYKIAGYSDYDWGQDLKRLAQWTEKQGIETIYLDFFGRAEPNYYLGSKYMPWRGSSWWELYGIEKQNPRDFPRGNYLAVSASFLPAGGWAQRGEGRDYAWLDGRDPVAKAGSSIFIYYIE